MKKSAPIKPALKTVTVRLPVPLRNRMRTLSDRSGIRLEKLYAQAVELLLTKMETAA